MCYRTGSSIVLAAFSLLICSATNASQAPEDILSLSLEELMAITVTTGSDKASSWREQPGLITVFHADDISAMGAKTLLDVMQRIPGTSLGIDVRNSIGLMMRGNWTLEGKILVLMNDMPLNEPLYGSWSPLPYVPADQLDRVEVLRGPGSSKYGGNAQMAVIRIYTRQHEEKGRVAYTQINQAGTNTGMLSFSDGFSTDAIKASVSGSINNGHWGNEVWIDNTGVAANTSDADTDGGTLALNIDVNKHTHYQMYYEKYDLNVLQGIGTSDPSSIMDLQRLMMSLSHDFYPLSDFMLTPHMNYRQDSIVLNAPMEPTVFDVSAITADGGFDASWQYSSLSSISFGANYQYQSATANETSGPYFLLPASQYFNGEGQKSYSTYSLYGNIDQEIGLYHLIVGARSSHHQYAGSALTPRVGLTRATDAWHFKWLYGEAFREPNIETIHYGTAAEVVRPERTAAHEFELGHKLLNNGYLTMSLFQQKVNDTIILSQDKVGQFTYNNNATLHSHGVDIQYLYKISGFSFNANYSYTKSNDDDIPLYDVKGRSGQYLGAPAQVGNFWLSVAAPLENLSFLLGGRYVGSRTANNYDASLVGVLMPPISQQQLPAETTLNAGVRYAFKKATITLGVDNITNEKQWLPQPYEGLSTPFPFGGRAIWMRGEWKFD